MLLDLLRLKSRSKGLKGEWNMNIYIDGHCIAPKPDQSLLDAIKELGLNANTFSDRPIAAKIAGEVFNLNYIPVRSKDIQQDRPSIRRAMAASGGQVTLLRYNDPVGREVYNRTAQFVLFLALYRLWPHAVAKMNCTLGPALYIEVSDCRDFCHEMLKAEVLKIVDENIPLIRRRIPLEDAVERFRVLGREDQVRLLSQRKEDYFDCYVCGEFLDYYYGETAPSTGFLQVWDIQKADRGFLFIYPDDHNPNLAAKYEEMPNFFQVFAEGEKWGQLMQCQTVADLNHLTQSGQIRELIRVNEALHEKRFSQVADMICQRHAKAVMLAGPSSSGKTTSANRLATQLRVHGKKPILMSLDDYYMDRDKIAPGPDGKLDLEHINTIDTELFAIHLAQLLRGETVELPTFSFQTGKREWHGHKLTLSENSVIIVEGLHALNPMLLPKDLEPHLIFKMYVSPLLPLNLDDHNRIPTSYLRLLRRTVRDYETRNSSVQRTMSMWDSVRRGEKRWIFPFQEQADVIFNSSTLYELAVLKKHIFPLLTAVQPEDECYEQVRNVVKILNYVQEAEVDDEIPPTSLVREFIGGNSFYRK